MTRKNDLLSLLVVVGVAFGACQPLVDGRYVGAPVAGLSGTADFGGAPWFPTADPELDSEFKLALLWTHSAVGDSAEEAPFVTASRTEGRAVQGAGTFTMDLFTLPPRGEGPWHGRLYAFVADHGYDASWTESYSPSPLEPIPVVLCDNAISVFPSSDAASTAQDTAPLFEELWFFEQPEDDPQVSAWRSCVDGSDERFSVCAAQPESIAESNAKCIDTWRAERDGCGEQPVFKDRPISAPLSLRCRDAVDEVPGPLWEEPPVLTDETGTSSL